MKLRNKDNSSIRDFIKKSATLGMGISASAIPASGEHLQAAKNQLGRLNQSSKKFMEMFQLKYPVVQAAPGGIDLAIAVANAGGMGAITLGWSSPEDAYKDVVKLKQATNGNFYGNFLLHFECKSLDKALEAGCPTVEFSWGIPTREMVGKIRAADAKLGIQVASKANALKALEYQPEFLICQGLEAGGHSQASFDLYTALEEILDVAGETPVLAAGGISTGHDIRTAINAGAAGTIMGTRLIATQESDVHDVYKKSLVEAGENSTVYTNCFNKDWHAMHRVLRNKTFLDWEAAGCPLEGNKPGEQDVIALHSDGWEVLRYTAMLPSKELIAKRPLTELVMYAGEGVKNVHDLPPAGDLIRQLWEEFENK